MRRRSSAARSAFSLVEMNLAILLIGLGMLVIFGLFPSGLREGENAESDTHTSLFAEFVFSGLRAKSQKLNWEDWQDLASFKLGPEDSVTFAPPIGDTAGLVLTDESAIQFPPGSSNYISTLIDVSDVPTDRVRSMTIWAVSGQYAALNPNEFKRIAKWYYTRFFYSGMQ